MGRLFHTPGSVSPSSVAKRLLRGQVIIYLGSGLLADLNPCTTLSTGHIAEEHAASRNQNEFRAPKSSLHHPEFTDWPSAKRKIIHASVAFHSPLKGFVSVALVFGRLYRIYAG